MNDKKIITDSDFLYNQEENNHEECKYYNGQYVDYDGLDITQWLKDNSLKDLLSNE
mgnify:CR=1 FL=1